MQNQSTPNTKKVLFFGALIAITAAIPLTVFFLQQQQDVRQRASTPSGTATIAFSQPQLQSPLNQPAEARIVFNPQGKIISAISARIKYNSSQITASNPTISQTLISSAEWTCPIKTITPPSGNVVIDIACANTTPQGFTATTDTHLATFTLTPSADPGAPVVLSFDPQETKITQKSDALDILLTPAGTLSFNIGSQIPSPTPTLTPTPTTGQGTPSPTPTLTPTPTTPPGGQPALTVLLQGIGDSGGNETPRTTQRQLTLRFFDTETGDQVGSTIQGPVTYNAASKRFIGNFDLSTIPAGTYDVKVKSPKYLTKQITNQTVSASGAQLRSVSLIVGDANDDNIIDILDYNIISNVCFGSKFSLSASCLAADLNDDGKVDIIDANFMFRNIAIREGD